jgi:hypothetical protein
MPKEALMKKLFILFIVLFSFAGCQPKDDGDSNVTEPTEPTETSYKATITPIKGPFVSGEATVQPIKCSDLKTQGESFTLLLNSFGQLEIDRTLPTSCLQVSVTGAYMDEITATQAEGTITLTGYADLSSTEVFTINPLTTISQGREYALVTAGTHTLPEAQAQVVGELTASLSLPDVSADGFYQLDFTSGQERDALLLLISAAVQVNSSTTGDVADRINRLQGDFQDGSFTEANITELERNANMVNPAIVRQNIIDWYADRGKAVSLPDFGPMHSYLADSDWDGVRDALDDADPVLLYQTACIYQYGYHEPFATVAVPFSPDADYNAKRVGVGLTYSTDPPKYKAFTGDMATFAIHADNAGEPGEVIATSSDFGDIFLDGSYTWQLHSYNNHDESTEAIFDAPILLAGNTPYWVVISMNASAMIGMSLCEGAPSSGPAKTSTNSTDWTAIPVNQQTPVFLTD